MKVFERYFSRNPVSRQLSFEADTAVIVIIPVFNDPDIFATLDSLCCCSVMNIKAGVLIVVNHSEVCPQEIKTRNIGLSDTLKRYVRDRQTDRLRFEVVEAFDLPAKYAGVGLARKIAMDLSAAFFYRNGRIDAPILSLDADTWVEPNYLEEVVRYFQEKSVAGVSIAYAHRLEEADMTVQAREAIMKYELYLRYYRLALEYTGHPHAYHCIGSAFAVRTLDYVAQGGMTKRQAGEDFYFLQ
ncbi:MAG: glycosyltransferase [Odoribacter splanchnicus]